MRVQYFFLWAQMAILLLLLAGNADGQPPVNERDVKSIKAEWQRRQDMVRTLRAHLTKENAIHRAQYLYISKLLNQRNMPIPDRDYIVPLATTVCMKGEFFFKHAYTGNDWNPVTHQLDPIEYAAITNPTNRITYENRPGSNAPADVSVSDRESRTDENVLSLTPLIVTVRPNWRIELNDYTFTGRRVIVEGRDCIELSQGSRSKDIVSIYLDPERGWVLRRLDVHTEGKLRRRISAEYAPDSTVGWLPSSWTWISCSPTGETLESGKVSAATYEVNVDLIDDEFRQPLPPKTFVVKDVDGRHTMSVIKDDGSAGVEVPVNPRLSYHDLEEINKSAGRQKIVLWIIGCGIILLLLLLAISRWRRRSNNPISGSPSAP